MPTSIIQLQSWSTVSVEGSEYGLYLRSTRRGLFQLWSKLLCRGGNDLHVSCPKDEDAYLKQRIYAHESIYDDFVPKLVNIVKTYKLGDPTEPDTNLGPVVSLASADRIREQVEDAGMLRLNWGPQISSRTAHEVKAGAKKLVAEEDFPVAKV